MLTWKHFLALAPAVLLVAWFLLFRPVSLGGPASYTIVSGQSMEPRLSTGDLAVLRGQDSYKQGDVVAFRVEGGMVIHRIIGGNAEEGFVVQGDNKTSPDWWRPKPDDIVGKMWFYIPGGGGWLAWLRQPLIIGIAVAGLTAFSLLGGGKAKRQRELHPNGGSGTPRATSDQRPPRHGWPLGVVALLAVVITAAAVYVFRQPPRNLRSW